jgi:hypothetical protein
VYAVTIWKSLSWLILGIVIETMIGFLLGHEAARGGFCQGTQTAGRNAHSALITPPRRGWLPASNL